MPSKVVINCSGIAVLGEESVKHSVQNRKVTVTLSDSLFNFSAGPRTQSKSIKYQRNPDGAFRCQIRLDSDLLVYWKDHEN